MTNDNEKCVRVLPLHTCTVLHSSHCNHFQALCHAMYGSMVLYIYNRFRVVGNIFLEKLHSAQWHLAQYHQTLCVWERERERERKQCLSRRQTFASPRETCALLYSIRFDRCPHPGTRAVADLSTPDFSETSQSCSPAAKELSWEQLSHQLTSASISEFRNVYIFLIIVVPNERDSIQRIAYQKNRNTINQIHS